MRFNINDHVKVKLTDVGRKIHRDAHDDLVCQLPGAGLKYEAPKEDSEGWSRWQLWRLMEIFGPHMLYPIPFETEIDIPSD